MRKIFIILLVALVSSESFSQKKDLVYFWPGKVPGELKEKQPPVIDPPKNDNVLRISEVTNPAFEVSRRRIQDTCL